jgi:hypothetical protein
MSIGTEEIKVCDICTETELENFAKGILADLEHLHRLPPTPIK